MLRLSLRRVVLLVAVGPIAGGCMPSRPFYFFEDGDLSHYKGVATEIEYPDVQQASLAEVEQAAAPLTLANSEAHEIWDLTLEETMRIALTNSKVMRTLGGQVPVFNAQAGQSFSPPSQLTAAPQSVQTVYEPALVESDPRFGTEAALAAFDTQFSTGLFWEKNDRPVNLFFLGFLAPIFEQDLATFRAQLSKTAATGTQLALRHNTNYDWNNNPSNRFPSFWTNDFEAEFRHPLLQGSGVQFNRIAGPNAVPGVYNGVVIARINTDIALADFEAGVRNLVSNVEIAYWRLYFAYRDLDAKVAGRDSALATWRKVNALYKLGARGGDADQEALAREQYFLFRGQVEAALSDMYAFENQLRYLMGLAATDGRLIRPKDEPTTARVAFDWHEVNSEALGRAVEVRQQRWRIKQRELQLAASKNFLLPRLDAVARYRWRGFGDNLISSDSNKPEFDNAWQTLMDGDFQEWQLGVQLDVPIGFRQQLSAVRYAELQLARERALLEDQELELSHLLSNALRDAERHYVLSRTQFNRAVAAAAQVEAMQAKYETGTITLDLLLDAQRRLADAHSQYYLALVNYNQAISQVHFRKGSLLEYNGIFLAEGPWASKAYYDAYRRARERDAATFIDYGFTRPKVISLGPVPQNVGPGWEHYDALESWEPSYREPTPAPPEPAEEKVPAPKPEPATMRQREMAAASDDAEGAVAIAGDEGQLLVPRRNGPIALTAGVSEPVVAAPQSTLEMRPLRPTSHAPEAATEPSQRWETALGPAPAARSTGGGWKPASR